MIAGAARLLAQRGLQETSFSEVLELTGAPRGSIYHHFPDGKDQLVASAVDLAGAHAIALIDRSGGSLPRRSRPTSWACGAKCSYGRTSRLDARCWPSRSRPSPPTCSNTPRPCSALGAPASPNCLQDGGLAEADAARFAAILIAWTEGAVVLSRAEQSMEPFELVADQLAAQLRLMSAR